MYQGLFWQHEDIDDAFLAARYDNGTGNLYKLSLSVFLKVCSLSCLPACGDEAVAVHFLRFVCLVCHCLPCLLPASALPLPCCCRLVSALRVSNFGSSLHRPIVVLIVWR